LGARLDRLGLDLGIGVGLGVVVPEGDAVLGAGGQLDGPDRGGGEGVIGGGKPGGLAGDVGMEVVYAS